LNSCCSSRLLRLSGILLLAGCTDYGPDAIDADDLCVAPTQAIHAIQGGNSRSPSENRTVTVRGVVTLAQPGQGIYLEATDGARPAGASRALFIEDEPLSQQTSAGEIWTVSGRVAELGKSRDKITALVSIEAFELCDVQNDLPLTPVRLPLDASQRESLEGMRLRFTQELSVSDIYNLSRGEATLSAGGVLRVPTEVAEPGRAALDLARSNRERSLLVKWPGKRQEALPVGTGFESVTGVLGHSGRSQMMYLEERPPARVPPLQDAPARTPGSLRIVDANLLNFFNGDGRGGGFPTERGAKSPRQYEQQSERLQWMMRWLQPDLLAVQELENDGFGQHSAARDLIRLLEQAVGADWAAIDPGGRLGGDVITVGLFYRPDRLEAVGRPHTLDSPEFRRLSRQPLAQLFVHRESGERFLLAVNHLKSKGRCPERGADSDQEDGQGCWNAARTAAVEAQLPWLKQLAEEAGTDNVLIVGDMNAWRNEQPVRVFLDNDFRDLVADHSGLPQHSFLYWGQTGTLDYAFGSASLAGHVRQASIWNVNANWPRRMEAPEPWLGASDHDPVIVDLAFSQSATPD
jgi:predicted extracellular nuclease